MNNLYIVATPIGNLQDITLRASTALLTADIIVSESTSKTGTLLEFLRKQFPNLEEKDHRIISMTEDEEELKIPQIIRILEENDVVLTSEAGTPLVSDPGFKLVREAAKRGINIVSLPGPSAVIAALTSSALPTDKFMFLGYIPKKPSKVKEILDTIKDLKAKIGISVILFESPHRLVEDLKTIEQYMGEINIVIARELTKIHEEILREKISDLINKFENNPPKGEVVLVI